ncbi:DUF6161 domain-containing protein [Sphingobacterium sp. Mn56C]|uniref:DUF6161 domain-containing protein n=1 Tax=Sphingobacterium sp. Mn56C TaxID=3395261 RepID=UPI003BCFBDAB
MNLIEVREITSHSEIMEELTQYTLQIIFPSNSEKYDFKGLFNIYKFIKDQKDKWGAVEQGKNDPRFRISKAFFDNAFNQIIGILSNVKNKSINKTNIAQSLANLKQSLKPNNQIFTFDAPEVNFLFSLLAKYPKSVDSAFQYITSGSVTMNNKDNAQGVFLAYEFQNKDISHIFNRRETEKKSLFELRRNIDKTANEYENTLTAHLTKSTEDYEEYKRNLDEFQQRSEDSLSQWMITHKGKFEGFHKESIEKISALENQYAELLKLKEPVEYWKEKATGLRKTGYWAFGATGICTLILAFFIYRLLWHTPEGLLESLFDGNRTAAIRWSIVFVIFISLFFIIIRAIMKFMFSNFHLARDAEEREKLTYLYLALISNGQFNEDERKIVMQSLFSRSDTGLLKEDSSPTMPGVNSLFDKIK